MPTSYDPNQPLLDPDIQQALEQGRQAQLAALLGQQRQSAAPRNLGEGIDALGKGFLQGVQNYMAGKNAAANNASMASALGGAQPMPFLGGASTMTPMSAAPVAGPPLASAASAGPSLVDSSYDPKGIGAGLQPQFADRLQDTLQDAADQGINATVTSGLRTPQQQTALYAQGRTAPGPIVTNAKPGSSYHNFGAAADVTPEGGGTPAQFAAIGDAAKNLGLKWGGDFKSINDQDHLQMPGSLADARAAQGGSTPASSSGVLAGIRAGETGNQPGYPVGDGGSSFGPYQMHMGGLASGGNSGAGLGDDFKRDTGLDPRDPSTLPAQEAWINNWAAGKSNAQIKQAFHGYKPEVAANGPASYGVPAGQVAGPGVPSTLEPTTQEGRAAALGVPTPPPAQEEEEAPTPPPVQPPSGPSMLSPTPMGAPQGFIPPSAAPQVAAQAVPPTVPAALPPAAPPPSAVAGGSGAPPGTHWAHLPGPPLLLAGDEGGGQAPQQAPQGGSGVGNLLAQLFGGGGQPGAQQQQIRAPAPMAAGLAQPGPQTASASNGLAGGLAGGQGPTPSPPAPNQLAAGLSGQPPTSPQQAPVSGNQAVYQQMYQAAAGPAARLQHAAAIAAASGNQALAQEYERQAAPFAAEMNKANDLAVAERTEKPQLFTRNDGSSYLGDPRTGQPVAQISPPKPVDQPLTEQEATAAGMKSAAGYQRDPNTGKIEPIGGQEAGGTPPTDQDKVDHPFLALPENEGLFNMDKNNNPIYVGPPEALLNSRIKQANEQKKEAAGTLTDTSGNPIPEGVTGDDLRSRLSPDVAIMADRMKMGKTAIPVLTSRTPANVTQAVLAAQRDEPGLDQNESKIRQNTWKDFTSGGPNSMAGTITAANTAILHIGEAAKEIPNLQNYQTGPGGLPGAESLNSVKNWYESSSGRPIGDTITRMSGIADRFNEEATKFYRGIGGTEADIARGQLRFNPNLPPSRFYAELQTQTQLMQDKVNQLQYRWHAGMGPNVPDFELIHPDTQKVIDAIQGTRTPQASAPNVPAPNAPAPAGPVGASMAPPRNVAPQITGAPPAPPAFNYDAIPKGQVYTGPDGKQRRKQ